MVCLNGIIVMYDNVILLGNMLIVIGIGVEFDDVQMEGVEYKILFDSFVFIENGDGMVMNKVSSLLNVWFGENGDYVFNGVFVLVDFSNGELVFFGILEDLMVVGIYLIIILLVDSVIEFG